MIVTVITRWREAYADPRTSGRRILSAKLEPFEAVALALLGAVLAVLFQRAVQFATGQTAIEALQMAAKQPLNPDRVALEKSPAAAIRDLAQQMLSFFAVSFVAWLIGSKVGGRASFQEMMSVVAWHHFISAPAAALVAVFVLTMSPDSIFLGLLASLVIMIYLVYVMAAFIAEAHGFESVGRVLLACFLVGVPLDLFVTSIVSIGMAPAT